MMKKLFKGADEKESRAHDHLRQWQKSDNYFNHDDDDDSDNGDDNEHDHGKDNDDDNDDGDDNRDAQISSRVNIILPLQSFANLQLYSFFIARLWL